MDGDWDRTAIDDAVGRVERHNVVAPLNSWVVSSEPRKAKNDWMG